MKRERIYLAGFMTCGKSTIGPILANVLGWSFYDLDKVIVEENEISIVEIFEKHGESHFRKIETETLLRLSKEEQVIIALGGGAMAQKENVEILKLTGTTIYLKASVDVIYNRIKNKIDRPAFRDFVLDGKPVKDFKQKIADMLKQRETYYMQADLIVESTDKRIGLMVDDMAKKIKQLLYQQQKGKNEEDSN